MPKETTDKICKSGDKGCNIMKFDMTEENFINNFVLPIAKKYKLKDGKVYKCTPKKKPKKN